MSIEFSRQEYWSGLSFPSPGDLPNPGIKPGSPALQADSLLLEPSGKKKKSHRAHTFRIGLLKKSIGFVQVVNLKPTEQPNGDVNYLTNMH